MGKLEVSDTKTIIDLATIMLGQLAKEGALCTALARTSKTTGKTLSEGKGLDSDW